MQASINESLKSEIVGVVSDIPDNCPVCGVCTIQNSNLKWAPIIKKRCDHDPIVLAEKAAEAAKNKAEIEAQRLAARQRLVGKIYAGGFESFDRSRQPEAYDIVSDYAANPKGWLFLTGDVGSGKTHLMAAAVIEIQRFLYKQKKEASDGWITSYGASRVKMINVSDLMAECRAAIDSSDGIDPIDTYKNYGLIALDDLGTQKRTDWSDENLYRLIDYRLVNELPMIMTSNNTLNEIASWDGWERITDRIVQAAKIIKLRAGSYRRESARARINGGVK